MDLFENDELRESALEKAEELIYNKIVIDDKCIVDFNTESGRKILDKIIKEEAANILKRINLLKEIKEAINLEPSFHEEVLELLFSAIPRKVLIEKSK